MEYRINKETLRMLEESPVVRRDRKGLDLTPRDIYLRMGRVIPLREVERMLKKT